MEKKPIDFTFYASGKQWRWRATSPGNHRILCHSERYHNRRDCYDTAVLMGCETSYADVVWHKADPRKKKKTTPKPTTP